MGIKIPAINRMSNLTNSASNLQQAITGMAQFHEIVVQELERKQKEREKKEEEKEQITMEFDPEELDANVETLVLRNKNSFKDRISVQTNNNTQTKQELQTEIKEPKQNKNSGIEKY